MLVLLVLVWGKSYVSSVGLVEVPVACSSFHFPLSMDGCMFSLTVAVPTSFTVISWCLTFMGYPASMNRGGVQPDMSS